MFHHLRITINDSIRVEMKLRRKKKNLEKFSVDNFREISRHICRDADIIFFTIRFNIDSRKNIN